MSAPAARVMISAADVSLPAGHFWRRLPAIGGIGAVVAAAATFALGAGDSKQVLLSWLVAFLFFLGIALGATYFVMIHYAVQAGWGIAVRRIAENVMATVPAFALAFIPLAWGVGTV